MKNKILSVVLTIAMVIWLFPQITTSVQATDDENFVASVTTENNVITNYTTLSEAIQAAASNNGSTLKLLHSINLGQNNGIIVSNGNFTLDLNNFSITASAINAIGNCSTIALSTGATLTIKDSSSAGGGYIDFLYIGLDPNGVCGSGLQISGGIVNLESGAIFGDNESVSINAAESKLNMSGGVIYGKNDYTNCEAIAIQETGALPSTKITISGGYLGRFNKAANLIWAAGNSVSNVSWDITGGYFDSNAITTYAKLATGYSVMKLPSGVKNSSTGDNIFDYQVIVGTNKFAQVFTYTDNIISTVGGTAFVGETDYLSATQQNISVTPGTSVCYFATAESNYTFDGWYNNTAFLSQDRISVARIYSQAISVDTVLYARFIQKPTTYTVSGTIKGSDTNSGIAATVQLKKDGNNIGSAVTANIDGTYTIPDVTADTYTIEVSCDGYDSVTINSFTVSGSNVTNKDLTLTKTVVFKPVTDIIMTNTTSVQANTDLTLAGSITPNDATNITVTWSVKDANNTGATITGNTFRATTSGTATVNTTIKNGLAENSNYTKEFTITVTAAPVTTYSISATAGTGGSISPSGSVTVNKGTSQIFTITPYSNYSITDVAVDNVSQGKITSYTFSNVTENHTVSATFSYNGGGTSSNNNNTSTSETTPPVDEPNAPIQDEVKVNGKINGTIDSNGNANVNITDERINDAYNKALDDAKKNGRDEKKLSITLNTQINNKSVNSITVNLPKTVQDIIMSKNIVNTVMVVVNPDIKVSIDLSTVKEISRQANCDVNITAKKIDSSTLSVEAKKVVGNRPIFNFEILGTNGNKITNFGNGSIYVSIPYTLNANEKAENIVVYYIDDNDKIHEMPNCNYDENDKTISFSTNHFSKFAVGYKDIKTTTQKTPVPKTGDINSEYIKIIVYLLMCTAIMFSLVKIKLTDKYII